jgi:acetyl esterase/lipase
MVALPPLSGPRPLGRRTLLLSGAGIAAAAVAGCGKDEPDPGVPIDFEPSVERISYAQDDPSQHGFFGVPAEGAAKALVVLIHGGFWFHGFTADLMNDAADDLRGRGFATWNIEYRRTDLTAEPPGGFPQTFRDIADAIDHIPKLPLAEQLPVAVVGHSAGGHLAVWAASRTKMTPGGAPKVKLTHIYSLSGVLDLATGDKEKVGNKAIPVLMGGSASAVPERYALGDPIQLVPASCPVTAIHVADDAFSPNSQSTSYVAADKAAGGTATYVEVPGDHEDMSRPSSAAWKAVQDGLAKQFG